MMFSLLSRANKNYHRAFISQRGACRRYSCLSSGLSSNNVCKINNRPAISNKYSINLRTHYTYSHAGSYESSSLEYLQTFWQKRDFRERGFTVGIGGPVGSGKTALVLNLARRWKQKYQDNSGNDNIKDDSTIYPRLGVITNDIFTQEDGEFLIRHNALSSNRIIPVETGGCPHTAIREDISANLSALETVTYRIQNELEEETPPLLLCESGGDNLAANFSRELADITIYVIDVSGGDKIPRKGGPGITQSDLLIVNKVDLAQAVGADLKVMERDANKMRSTKSTSNHQHNDKNEDSKNETTVGPTIFASIKLGQGLDEISNFILSMYDKAIQTAKENEPL